MTAARPKAETNLSHALVAALLCITAGCRSETPRASPPAAAGQTAATPPSQDAQLLAAIESLTRGPRDVVRLPPFEAPPAGDVVRLNDLTISATIRSEWHPPPPRDNVLAAVTADARSGTLARPRSRSGDGHRWFELSGFSVNREEVGRVVLAARFPPVPYFMVEWDDNASLQVNIEDPKRSMEYSISTDGLTHWKGPLRSLYIGLPQRQGGESQAGPVVQSLEFQRRAAAYPDAGGVARLMLNRQLRNATYLHAPGSIHYQQLNLRPAMRMAVGVSAAGGTVAARISVRGGAADRILIEQSVAADDAWHDVSIPVPEGDRAELVIEASGPPGSVLLLADPTLYVSQSRPPRCILYLIDTLSAPRMSLYGNRRATTPNLDRLASEGLWFSNAFSNATRTVESVANLHLSMHTASHGIDHEYAVAPPAFTTMAEVFQAAGWATASFVTNVNAGPRNGMDQGFDSFFDHLGSAREGEQRTIRVKAVTDWLEAHRDRPVFVYIHTAEPHHPHNAPHPFGSKFAADVGAESLSGDVSAGAPEEWRGPPNQRRLASYDGDVAFADHRFGRFHAALAEQGLLDRTLLIVTADHGEEFLEHGETRHGQSVYAELTRVPLIFHGPEVFARSGRIDANVQLIDVMPTLVDLFGLRGPPAVQGDSLVPLIEGEAERFDDRAIVTATFMRSVHWGIMRSKWKLVVLPPGDRRGGDASRFRLFDTRADPGEFRDVLRENADVALELARELGRTAGRLPRYYRRDDTRRDISKKHVDQLRDLGYLQ